MLLDNKWDNEEIKEKIKKWIKMKSGNTIIKNLKDTVKVVLKGKFIAIQACLSKQKISNHQELEKKPTKPKISRRKRKT